ncbi:hypothetical protein GCM10028798_21550 [Humibacter antri]
MVYNDNSVTQHVSGHGNMVAASATGDVRQKQSLSPGTDNSELLRVLSEIVATKDELGLADDEATTLASEVEHAVELANDPDQQPHSLARVVRSIQGLLAPVALSAATTASSELAKHYIDALLRLMHQQEVHDPWRWAAGRVMLALRRRGVPSPASGVVQHVQHAQLNTQLFAGHARAALLEAATL